MTILKLDRNIEFEKDLLDLLVEHGIIPEERKDKIKRANLSVHSDKPITLEVHEHDD